MMKWLRAWLSRNRGIVAALGFVVLLFPATSPLRTARPRVSWTERWNAPQDEAVYTFGNAAPSFEERVQFSPDSKTILMVDRNGARIRDLETGRLKELSLADESSDTGHKRLLNHFDFLEGGKLLVGVVVTESETSGASLRVWEVQTGRVLLHIDDLESPTQDLASFQRSDDGSTLAYAMGRPGPLTVGVWRNKAGWERRYFAGGVPLALSPDGRKLALIEPTESGTKLMVWDVEKSEPLGSIELSRTAE